MGSTPVAAAEGASGGGDGRPSPTPSLGAERAQARPASPKRARSPTVAIVRGRARRPVSWSTAGIGVLLSGWGRAGLAVVGDGAVGVGDGDGRDALVGGRAG